MAIGKVRQLTPCYI